MGKITQIIKELVTGGIIGIANIIPGVSGGTMALVLGIYERLINAIHNISATTIKTFIKLFTLKKENINAFKEECRRIDILFLIKITVGALIAIVALAKLMTYLLTSWHDPTYGFFFGLVLVSAFAPYKMIKKKGLSTILVAIIAIASVVAVSQAVSGDKMLEKAKLKYELKIKKQQGSKTNTPVTSTSTNAVHLIYIFLLGAISISAMILPGVSGSFLLLLLGGYFEILKAIADRNLLLLGVFALGCMVGVLLFTRLLNFLLKKFYDQTMAFLLGLVLGSLWMIWPFKTSQKVGDEIIYLSNTVPGTVSFNVVLSIITALTGMVIVGAMIWIENKKENN